jgi:hypothetical protein
MESLSVSLLLLKSEQAGEFVMGEASSIFMSCSESSRLFVLEVGGGWMVELLGLHVLYRDVMSQVRVRATRRRSFSSPSAIDAAIFERDRRDSRSRAMFFPWLSIPSCGSLSFI